MKCWIHLIVIELTILDIHIVAWYKETVSQIEFDDDGEDKRLYDYWRHDDSIHTTEEEIYKHKLSYLNRVTMIDIEVNTDYKDLILKTIKWKRFRSDHPSICPYKAIENKIKRDNGLATLSKAEWILLYMAAKEGVEYIESHRHLPETANTNTQLRDWLRKKAI